MLVISDVLPVVWPWWSRHPIVVNGVVVYYAANHILLLSDNTLLQLPELRRLNQYQAAVWSPDDCITIPLADAAVNTKKHGIIVQAPLITRDGADMQQILIPFDILPFLKEGDS